MADLYQLQFLPIAQIGQLVAVQRTSDLVPTQFFRVAQLFALPERDLSIAANASQEQETDLEVPPFSGEPGRRTGWMAQYRFVVTTASQIVLRRPIATAAYTTRSGRFRVSNNTDETWTGTAGRFPPSTEFFVMGGDTVAFDELANVAATVRFGGFKFLLQEVSSWLVRDLNGQVLAVNPATVGPERLHRLENLGAVIMADQQ